MPKCAIGELSQHAHMFHMEDGYTALELYNWYNGHCAVDPVVGSCIVVLVPRVIDTKICLHAYLSFQLRSHVLYVLLRPNIVQADAQNFTKPP